MSSSLQMFNTMEEICQSKSASIHCYALKVCLLTPHMHRILRNPSCCSNPNHRSKDIKIAVVHHWDSDVWITRGVTISDSVIINSIERSADAVMDKIGIFFKSRRWMGPAVLHPLIQRLVGDTEENRIQRLREMGRGYGVCAGVKDHWEKASLVR